MTFVMEVPGSEIYFEPKLDKDLLAKCKQLISDLDCIEIDSEGLYINELEWFDVGTIEADLAAIAKQLKKNHIRARGGLFVYFGEEKVTDGKDKIVEIEVVDSRKWRLSGGDLKESKGYIRPVRSRRHKSD